MFSLTRAGLSDNRGYLYRWRHWLSINYLGPNFMQDSGKQSVIMWKEAGHLWQQIGSFWRIAVNVKGRHLAQRFLSSRSHRVCSGMPYIRRFAVPRLWLAWSDYGLNSYGRILYLGESKTAGTAFKIIIFVVFVCIWKPRPISPVIDFPMRLIFSHGGYAKQNSIGYNFFLMQD